MTKVLKCRDVGMDCDFEARGKTEDEILVQAAEHARRDHGMESIPKEVAAAVKAAIRDE
jgi:predicted small metal-binding protein